MKYIITNLDYSEYKSFHPKRNLELLLMDEKLFVDLVFLWWLRGNDVNVTDKEYKSFQVRAEINLWLSKSKESEIELIMVDDIYELTIDIIRILQILIKHKSSTIFLTKQRCGRYHEFCLSRSHFAENCDVRDAWVSPKIQCQIHNLSYFGSIFNCVLTNLKIGHDIQWKNDIEKWQFDYTELDKPQLIPTLPIKTDNTGFDNLYKNKKFSDFNIMHIPTNKSWPVHRTILYSFGGTFFEKLFDCEFKENTTHQLELSTYSYESLNYFINFMYQQPNNCDNINPVELYAIASFFMNGNFKNHSLNLLSAHASANDYSTLKELHQTYNDRNLALILDRLITV